MGRYLRDIKGAARRIVITPPVRVAAVFFVLVCGMATAQYGPPLTGALRVAAAAAPLRISEPIATRLLPGHYDGKHPGVVRIDAYGTFFCKGPDYNKGCVRLTGVAAGRTMAVNDAKGRTVLLEYNNETFSRVCSINTEGFRTTLDCRVVDFTRLADYSAKRAVDRNGKVLMVDAVDGKYVCGEPSGFRQCSRISDKAGRPIQKPKN